MSKNEQRKGGQVASVANDERPLGFGCSAPTAASPAAVESPPNGVDSATGKPYCGRHNVLMVVTSSAEHARYYKCPVDGCEERSKRSRHGVTIPSRPTYCARVSCAPHNVAMEVDAAASSYGQLKMVCGRCGNASYVTASGFALDYRFRQEVPVEDFSSR